MKKLLLLLAASLFMLSACTAKSEAPRKQPEASDKPAYSSEPSPVREPTFEERVLAFSDCTEKSYCLASDAPYTEDMTFEEAVKKAALGNAAGGTDISQVEDSEYISLSRDDGSCLYVYTDGSVTVFELSGQFEPITVELNGREAFDALACWLLSEI